MGIKQILKEVFKLSDSSKITFIILFFIIALNSIFALIQPMFLGYIIDAVSNQRFGDITKILLCMCLMFGMTLILSFIRDKLSVSLAVKSENTIRIKLMKYFFSEKHEINPGNLITHLEEDAKIMSSIIFNHLDAIFDLFSVFVTLVIMLVMNVKLTAVLLFLVPIQAIILSFFSRILNRAEYVVKESQDEYLRHANETVQGREAFLVFNKVQERIAEFGELILRFGRFKSSLFINRTYQNILIQLSLYSYNIFIISYALYLISQGNLTLGDFIAYTTYSNSIISTSLGLSELGAAYQSLKVSLNRLRVINEVEDKEIKVTVLQDKINNLEIKQLNYAYSDNRVLDNINFSLKKSNLYILNSPSGKGKTTLLNLISGVKKTVSGEFLLNHAPVSSIPRDKIAYMTQNSYIFSMSIYENLRFYNSNLSNEEIEEVCRKLEIDTAIRKLEDGYHTILTSKNPELSGGQIQRLCLARTLLRQADIYLLDEPLSNLDRKISCKIMKLIKELSRDSIVIMNCHHQYDDNLVNRVLTI